MFGQIFTAIILIFIIYALYFSIKFIINKARDIEQLKEKMEYLVKKDKTDE